jgi:hypothetical protein
VRLARREPERQNERWEETKGGREELGIGAGRLGWWFEEEPTVRTCH